MNLPNPVRAIPVRLFAAALALLSIPALAQTVVVKPAPAPAASATPAVTPEPTATPASTVTITPAPEIAPTAAPATPPTVTVTPAAAVTVTPADATPAAPAADTHAQMTKMQSSMTENMAKNDAADAAMKTHMDAMNAGAKSDMEMKHAIIAQLQAMSDQIQQLNDKVAALSTPPEPAAKPAKAVKAKTETKPAVRAPIKPVY